MKGKAIPILPTRDLQETIAFYTRLGFEVGYQQTRPDVYLILSSGDIVLHFFGFPDLDPGQSYAGCYLKLADADAVYREWQKAGLPSTGFPRLTTIEDRPWGMREFHLLDPNGTLIRIGHEIG